VFDGHSDAIRHVEANADASLMLSACADHSLRIWDMNTQRCLSLFSGHTGLVVSTCREMTHIFLVKLWILEQHYPSF